MRNTLRTLRILQCNTDNLRYGYKYISSLAIEADLVFLQRFPKDKKSDLQNTLGQRVFMVESCPPHNLCLAIGRTVGSPNFDNTESIVLPSYEDVMKTDDAWQGCTALKTVINGVNFVNVLPAYESDKMSDFNRKSDLSFLLKRFKDNPTIIFGDFHVKPNAVATNQCIESNGFKSYIDDAMSFKGCAEKPAFNLDKCISNIDITIDNITVHPVPTDRGHFAITYNVTLPTNDKYNYVHNNNMRHV